MSLEVPVISIIIPVYNAAQFLEETLSSVHEQTHVSWEALLVVDAKSDQASESICHEWALRDSRFLVVARQSAGAANNRNEGLKRVRGRYIAFLDADDLWQSQKLERQLRFMELNQAAISCHAYQRVDEVNHKQGRILSVPKKIQRRDLLLDNRIGCLTVMLSADLARGIFFEDMGWEDFGYWLKCLRKTDAIWGLNENLASYRVVETSRSNNKIFAAKMRWMALRGQEKIPVMSAAFWMLPYVLTSLKKYSLRANFRAKID